MFWEELKNALKGRGWINNADFQKKVEEARKDITENFGIVRDGKYVPFDLNGLNDDQIIGLQTYLHQQSAAGNTINQGDAKPQGDALTPSSVGITVPGGSGPSTVGQGLKNVRDISSGRLKGYSRGNTEMPGGAQAAKYSGPQNLDSERCYFKVERDHHEKAIYCGIQSQTRPRTSERDQVTFTASSRA